MKIINRMKKPLAAAVALTMLSTTVMASDFDSHWAKNAITEWSGYGVVAGYKDGTFKPNNNVTRAELASFITRVFGLTDAKPTTYKDVSADAWYQDAVAKVTAAGIMKGADNKFNPNAPATRQETAAVLANAYKLTTVSTTASAISFKDDSEIAAWAKQSVGALAKDGYIGGRPDGSFDPAANVTRGEVISILDRLTEGFINKAGTYTGDKKGNVVVNIKDVILDGMTIDGNLYLAEGIGTGDVNLNKVTVKGQTFISGGGVNSIKMHESVLPNGAIIYSTHPIRIVSEGNKISIIAKEGTAIVLTGVFDKVEIPAGVKAEFKAATVEVLTVVPSVKNAAAKAEIVLDATSTVKKLIANASVAVTGTGKITELVVNAAGVTTTMKPTTITIKAGITASIAGVTMDSTGAITSGGGGGGGGSTGGGTGTGDGGGTVTPVAKPITISGVKLYNGATKVWENDITGNVIKLNEATLASAYGKEVDSILLTLNVPENADVALSNALDTQAFKANKSYSITKFIAFGERNKADFINDAVKLLATLPGFTEAEAKAYVQGKIVELEDAAGIDLDDLTPTNGELNIKTTVEILNKLQAYATTTERKAFLSSILKAVGISATEANGTVTYETKASLEAQGFDKTIVTIQISK